MQDLEKKTLFNCLCDEMKRSFKHLISSWTMLN